MDKTNDQIFNAIRLESNHVTPSNSNASSSDQRITDERITDDAWYIQTSGGVTGPFASLNVSKLYQRSGVAILYIFSFFVISHLNCLRISSL